MMPARRCRQIALTLALGLCALPGAAGTADDALQALAAKAGQSDPLFRIGLDDSHRILISSEGPYRIVDPATGQPVWRSTYSGEVAVVAEGGPEGSVPSVYRIQVGAFSSEDAAKAERARLEKRFGERAVVRRIPDRGSWRVRLGEAKSRDGLAKLMDRLRAAGFKGLWIVQEPVSSAGDVTLRLVDASYDSRPTDRTRLAVVPTARARIEVEGKPYRGIVELRVSPFGTVRPVNWVGLEAYLLGVVPAELGPEVWPQAEALKAQAVAARTYAWRNRGQFEDEGFDLCATPRCQVYGGAAAEHPMSDRAVAQTRGEILTWEGRPITALYTATCGGHTEDAGEIFPEEKAPYLVGVPCRAEGDAIASQTVTVKGQEIAPVVAEDGEDVTRDWALLAAAGVVEPDDSSALRAAVKPGDLRRWTGALARLAGRPAPAGEPGPVDHLGQAAAAIVRDLGWEERAKLLLSEQDLPALLRDPGTAALPVAERRALGCLALAGGVHPLPDGSYHAGNAPSGARLLPALARVGESYRAFGLTRAVVAGRSARGLRLALGKGEIRLPMADRPFLFRLSGGKATPTPMLDLWPGDRVSYRTNSHGKVDFVELVPPVKGTSDDRAASVYSWEVRKTRRELESAINRRASVGRLQDLRVRRRGRSGRVVELEVIGSAGSTVVRGYDVRRLLDLRESLTVIELQRDGEGHLEAVVFAGKGWGHGVGLCQVGAYGMALRGKTYREILAHYYRGAVLEPLRPRK